MGKKSEHLLIPLLTLLVISTIGCGVGHSLPSYPAYHSLESYEGEWDYEIDFEGTVSDYGVTNGIRQEVEGTLTIREDQIFDDEGWHLPWEIDGYYLIVYMNRTFVTHSSNCGMTTLRLESRLKLGRPSNNKVYISGRSDAWVSPALCPGSSGTIGQHGYMEREEENDDEDK